MMEFLEENGVVLLGGIGAALVSGVFGIVITLLARREPSKRGAHHQPDPAEKNSHPIRRRIAVLVSFDIVGLSQLISEDEIDTFRQVKEAMIIMKELVEQNDG